MSSPTQQDLVVSPRLVIPAAEFSWTFSRASGPGGQNVNKVNSKALLRWSPVVSPSMPDDIRQRLLTRHGTRLTNEGELLIESEEGRDQVQNIRRCLDKLRELLTSVLRPPKVRRPTRPTAGSQRRRLADKQHRTSTKQNRRAPPSE